MKKLSKKQIIIVIICAVVLAVGGSLTAIMLTVVTPLKPKIPAVELLEYQDVNQAYIELSWQKQKGAVLYKLEYVYSLFPTTTHEVVTDNNTVKLERIKGSVSVRIKSLAKYVQYDTEYSEWKEFSINGIKLNAPEVPNYIFHEIESWRYYTLDVYDDEWSPVAYNYKGYEGKIYFYEIAIVAPGNDEEYSKNNPLGIFDLNELGTQIFSIYHEEDWYIFIRAVNTKGDWGDFDGENERNELYTLYEKSDWTQITIKSNIEE